MSREKVKSRVGEKSFGRGYALPFHIEDTINGKLYQIIETIGLPEKQEKAVKKSVQEIIWRIVKEYSTNLKPETYSNIVEEAFKLKVGTNRSLPVVIEV